MTTRRRRRLVGVVLGLGGLMGGLAAWRCLDPWAPRRVIHAPGAEFGWGIPDDGRWLITSGSAESDGHQELRAWDLTTGAPRRGGAKPLVAMRSEAADGRSYVGVVDDWRASRREVVRVDSATGEIRERFATGPAWPLHPHFADGDRSVRAYLADPLGHRIGEVATWDLATRAEARRPFRGPPAGDPGFRPMIAAPDGRTLVYLGEHRDDVLLWDGVTDRSIRALPRTSLARIARQAHPAITEDGRTLIIPRDDGQAEVWNVPEGRLVREVVVHSRGFRAFEMAITPAGRLLASGGESRSPPTLLDPIWDRIGRLAPALDRRTFAEVVIVDLATGRRLARLPGEQDPMIAPDGRTLVTRAGDSFPVRDLPPPQAFPRQ